MSKEISEDLKARFVEFQRDEITAYIIYNRIADREKDEKNKATLKRFANEEKNHAEVFERYTGVKSKVNRFKVWLYTVLSYLLGYTFVIKLMENNEQFTVAEYKQIENEIPEITAILAEEEEHEEMLIDMLDEERLQYVGSIVLGLNDALVELTGAIAGLTFALANTRIVALSAIITGISATLSMAASNFLAERAEGNPKALKSSVYTGVAYLITVVLMVLPYLLFPVDMYLPAFIVMIATVILIILAFNYYISVARSEPFLKNFATMAIISLSVAAISFVIGLVAKSLLGVDI